MKFSKLHGAGNDFIIIDCRHIPLDIPAWQELAKSLCQRRLHIGADGLMAIVNPKGEGDFAMVFINADGTVGEMCGNGSRCIARFAYDRGIAPSPMTIETKAGMITATRLDHVRYQVALNLPTTIALHQPLKDAQVHAPIHYVELGNPGLPHAIVELESPPSMDKKALWTLGYAIRHDPAFPQGANVTFVAPHKDSWIAHTWERGVEGFTLACGTGAGATATVLTALKKAKDNEPISITMPGGTLEITVKRHGDTMEALLLTGPTFWVADGETMDCV